MNTMNKLFNFVILLSLPLRTCLACTSRNFARNAGETAAIALADEMRRSANQLDAAIASGGDSVKVTATELRQGISDLAQKVNVKLDSGDLSNVGLAATKNLRSALTELSKKWELAVSTADVKDMGIEISKELSKALQNINIKLQLSLSVDDNIVVITGFLSIAIGFAFSVCLVAMVIVCGKCLRSRPNRNINEDPVNAPHYPKQNHRIAQPEGEDHVPEKEQCHQNINQASFSEDMKDAANATVVFWAVNAALGEHAWKWGFDVETSSSSSPSSSLSSSPSSFASRPCVV